MKKTIYTICFITLLIISSCSKENRIEKNLWKKGGDWEITQYMSWYGSYNPSQNGGINPTQEYYNDCGKFHFSKDGTGTLNLVIDGDNETWTFHYTNSDKELTLVYDSGASQIYKLDWSKNFVTISYENPSNDPDGFPFVDSERFSIDKI
jgi:hypothetical protein